LAYAHNFLNLAKHSFGVLPSTDSAIAIHRSFVATVVGTAFIPVSIYFCYSSDQFSAGTAAVWPLGFLF